MPHASVLQGFTDELEVFEGVSLSLFGQSFTDGKCNHSLEMPTEGIGG